MDDIGKQMAQELLEAAEEFLQDCPGCVGLDAQLIDEQLSFDFMVDPSGPEPVVRPAGCVCRRLRKAAREFRAYETVNP